jgi:hypothetical protein
VPEAVIFALPGQFLASIGVFAYVPAENAAGARDKAREAVRAGFGPLGTLEQRGSRGGIAWAPNKRYEVPGLAESQNVRPVTCDCFSVPQPLRIPALA